MKQLLCIIISLLPFIGLSQEDTPDIIRGNEQYEVVIKVLDADSRQRIDDVEVYLYQTAKGELIKTQTTHSGMVVFDLEPDIEYELRTCHPSYLRHGISLFECQEGNDVVCLIGADDYTYVAGGGKDKPMALLNATLHLTSISTGTVFELDNVYYDLDEAHLRPPGKEELQQLAKIMERNPSITIELSSHTDSRASEKYNKDLSQRRAESCLDYLVSLGISKDRIRPVGYGESKLVNECKDGVECSEEKHQKNRRTEIEVLTFSEVDCTPSLDIDLKPKDLKNDDDRM